MAKKSKESEWVKNIDLKLMDDTDITLSECGTQDVFEELADVAHKFKAIGDMLSIKPATIRQIQDKHKSNHDEGLKAVIEEYLNGNYNVVRFGPPTWVRLVRVVSSCLGGNNHTLAQKIATKHKRGTNVPTARPVEETPGDHRDVTFQHYGPNVVNNPAGPMAAGAMAGAANVHVSPGRQISAPVDAHPPPSLPYQPYSYPGGLSQAQGHHQHDRKTSLPGTFESRYARPGHPMPCVQEHPPSDVGHMTSGNFPAGSTANASPATYYPSSVGPGSNVPPVGQSHQRPIARGGHPTGAPPTGAPPTEYSGPLYAGQAPINRAGARTPPPQSSQPHPTEMRPEFHTPQQTRKSFGSHDPNSATPPRRQLPMIPTQSTPKDLESGLSEQFRSLNMSGANQVQPQTLVNQPPLQHNVNTSYDERQYDTLESNYGLPSTQSTLNASANSSSHSLHSGSNSTLSSHSGSELPRCAPQQPPYQGPQIQQPPYQGPPSQQPPYHGPPSQQPPYQGAPRQQPPQPSRSVSQASSVSSQYSDPNPSSISSKYQQQHYMEGSELEESNSYPPPPQPGYNRRESVQSGSSGVSDYESSVSEKYRPPLLVSSAGGVPCRGGNPGQPSEAAAHPVDNFQPKITPATYSIGGQSSMAPASTVQGQLIQEQQQPHGNQPPVFQQYPQPGYGQPPRLVVNPHIHPSLASQGSERSRQSMDRPRNQQAYNLQGPPMTPLTETTREERYDMRVEDMEDEQRVEDEEESVQYTSSYLSNYTEGHGHIDHPSSQVSSTVSVHHQEHYGQFSHQPPSVTVHGQPASGVNHSLSSVHIQQRFDQLSHQAPSEVGGHGVHGQPASTTPSQAASVYSGYQAAVLMEERQEQSEDTSVASAVAVEFDYSSLMVQESRDADVQSDGAPIPRKVINKKSVQIRPDFTERIQTIKLSFDAVTPEKGDRNCSPFDEVYNMDRASHGLAIIINNDSFTRHKERIGSQVDEENLTLTFCYLGFSVEVHHNLTSSQMCQLFQDLSKRDHSKYDSFVCCILTHGRNFGEVAGSDSDYVVIDHLTASLCAGPCPSLKGKPKIFFIQACRGHLKCHKVTVDGEEIPEADQSDESDLEDHFKPDGDEGSILKLAIERSLSREYTPGIERSLSVDYGGAEPDAHRVEPDAEIPDATDFFFGYATPSGHVAWRDLDHGSWYISELCRALCQYSSCLSLDGIMLQVHREVGDRYGHEAYKQAPETTTRLRKKVFF